MKLSATTLEVLKSFAAINKGMQIKEGDLQETISGSSTLIAKVRVPDSFERSFHVYDLGQLLAVVGLFSEPELSFQDTYLTVSEGEEKINYRYASPDVVKIPPQKEIKFPESEITISLSADSLNKILKAGSVLGAPEVALVGEDGSITVRALNTKESSGNNYQFKVGETDREFRVVFSVDNLKLLPDDYTVEVARKGDVPVSRWVSNRATYFVAIEAGPSNF